MQVYQMYFFMEPWCLQHDVGSHVQSNHYLYFQTSSRFVISISCLFRRAFDNVMPYSLCLTM